tara:strand:- start:141 stop:539 length:399 start_codon:yes stop_codon:yes gene_type:complete
MVNYVSILIASVLSFVVGMLWYSPALFGNKWAKLAGVSMGKAKKKSMGSSMLLGFISTLVLAYVFQYLIETLGYIGAAAGATLGFWLWLGFLATSLIGGVLWEGKSWSLYVLNSAYWLVNLLVIGAALGRWA